MRFPIGGPLKPSLSRTVVEILCVKDLDTHIPVENALISIFFVLGDKIGVTAFCNFVHIAAAQNTSFELLTLTIGSRASLLQCLDFPIENVSLG